MSTKVTIKFSPDKNGYHLYEDIVYGLGDDELETPVFLTLHNCGFEANVLPDGTHSVTVEIKRDVAIALGLLED